MLAERIPERTTAGVFFRQADRLAQRTLVRHHDGTAWRAVTWSEMRELVLRVAARLVALGVERGDRVVIMAANCLEWLYCDLGIMAAGAVTVPIYPSTPARVARQVLANSEARLAFASNETLAGRLADARVVRMDLDLPAWVARAPTEAELAAVAARLEALSPDDLCTLVYTSGTTGEPKGVMLAHRSLVDMARSCLEVFALGEGDEALSFLPFSHVFERVNGLQVGIAAGAGTWLSRGVDRLAEDIAECRPTVMVSVPRVYEKMHQRVMEAVAGASPLRRLLFRWAIAQGRDAARGRPRPLLPLADRLVLRGLRKRLTGGRLRFFVSGGAPLARDVEEFFWSLGVKILNGWGMTETSSGACSNTEARHRFETVGPPLPGVEFRLAEDGEILVRGPGNMLGYFRNPEATARALADGWVLTGDIGEIDADGFVRITDRKKDLLKTAGGKFVAPQPLEAQLQRSPLVERAVVIGDERPFVTALIVPDWAALRREIGISGEPPDLVEDARARAAVQGCVDDLNRDLGSWETVKAFALLPRDFSEEGGELTPTLKVKRKVVTERHRELIDRMYSGARRPERAAGAH